LVGFAAYRAGRAAHIAGVVARGDRLTIRLVGPVPDLESRLAEPYFCAVPTDTPIAPRGVRIVPSAGPYYVSALSPAQSIVLERNPGYRGPRPHRAKRIVVTLGVSRDETAAAVEAGGVDFAADGVPPSEHARLAAAFGPGSAAARAGRQQYFVKPVASLDYLLLNARRPLFGNVRMRKAVNFAIDRRGLAGQGSAGRGIGFPGQPTDQYLPPGMQGFRDVRVYPPSPDVAAARRLTRGRHGTAVLYVCDFAPCPQYAQIVRSNLRAIGIATAVRSFALDELFARMSRPGEPFDLLYFGHVASTPDPGAFLEGVLGRAAWAAPPTLRRKLEAARRSGDGRAAAYAKLDRDLVRNDVPWVAIANQEAHDFFSARIGCQVHQPTYGVDLGALCIRG
jgi:peptide/nickel transport system substrate-binding protein